MGSHLGALKVAAARIGVSIEDYETNRAAGLKWCHGCGGWQQREEFKIDRSRGDGLSAVCAVLVNTTARAGYQRKGPPLRAGPAPLPARDGDKRQARKRVNQMVLAGRLARPNDLPCFDCGHRRSLGTFGGRRHEYDHYLGYDALHHLAVQAVCSRCHHRRARDRGELKGGRRHV
jgi:hypothetical protein